MDDICDPRALRRLERADAETFRAAVHRYLANGDAAVGQVLRNPLLRRRTQAVLRSVIARAEEATAPESGLDSGRRGRWVQIRAAARAERAVLRELPKPADSPRRRAMLRLVAELPEEWRGIRKEGGGRPVSPRHLVDRHPSRFRDLLNEELRRDDAATT